MATEGHRFKGVARGGIIELEAGATLPDGAEVIVLVVPEAAPADERRAALARLKEIWEHGLHLGGGPPMTRDDLYGDTGRPR
ncbi:MAG TPA: hypothetical protein PLL78_08490 [Fimbriimonadaceae bacterium]|nr:hypothetical protein [Fimbriimonadaceae bacterium]HRJ96714.1 hypothetical protein [Fimbriimonadaceae bacterium]